MYKAATPQDKDQQQPQQQNIQAPAKHSAQPSSPVKLQDPSRTPSPIFQLHVTAGPAVPANRHTATQSAAWHAASSSPQPADGMGQKPSTEAGGANRLAAESGGSLAQQPAAPQAAAAGAGRQQQAQADGADVAALEAQARAEAGEAFCGNCREDLACRLARCTNVTHVWAKAFWAKLVMAWPFLMAQCSAG